MSQTSCRKNFYFDSTSPAEALAASFTSTFTTAAAASAANAMMNRETVICGVIDRWLDCLKITLSRLESIKSSKLLIFDVAGTNEHRRTYGRRQRQ